MVAEGERPHPGASYWRRVYLQDSPDDNAVADAAKRAQEARALADQINDSYAKVAMLRIADEYEHLAKRAAARAVGRDPNSN
jgi:hypothetical protein